MSNKLNVYACGGAGTNVASQLLKYQGKKEHGFCEFDMCFIDTSASNFTSEIPKDQTYLVDGLDGSGKKRDSNYVAIAERAKEIMQKFKPADINIVIHSASGGSGSVIGPILAGELSKKSPTVIIIIGSSDSRIETDNTIKTLRSYEVISRKKEYPIAAMYYENSKEIPRSMVDSYVKIDISLLSMLYSGDNSEMDTADLDNFINYNKVTTYSPALCNLGFFTKEITLGKDQYVASVATLGDTADDVSLNIPVEYQAVGYVRSSVAKESLKLEGESKLPLHVAMIIGFFNPIVERLEEKLKVFDEHRSAVIQKQIVNQSHEDKATDEGLLF